MATQRFGDGRSALLACDSLWRWKLSINSENQAFDDFWNNLVNWLTAGSKIQPYWRLKNSVVEAEKQAEIKYIIPIRSNIEFSTLDFEIQNLRNLKSEKIKLLQTAKGGEYMTTFTPKANSSYKLIAKHKKKIISQVCFSSGQSLAGRELMALQPDIETIRKLASPYNNIIIHPAEEFDWQS